MKKILITGCGRSGTGFASKLFNDLGLRIGHEVIKQDGTSDWREAYTDKEYEYVLHQVRNPIKVISSCQTITKKSWDYIFKKIKYEKPKNIIECGMIYWIFWNEYIDTKSNYRYRIENIENEIENIFDIINMPLPKNYKTIITKSNKKTNSRKHTNLNSLDLKNTNEDIYNKIKILSKDYGYDNI